LSRGIDQQALENPLAVEAIRGIRRVHDRREIAGREGTREGRAMNLPFTSLGWVEIIVAGVAGVVVGFVWYLPMVFGRRWAASAGRELPAAGDVSPVLYLGSVVQGLVIAYALALLAAGVGAVGLTDHLLLAFLIWLGFIATTTINVVLYEGRSLEYWLINNGFALVSLLAMGAIFAYL
jgi:hypothetical protein